MTVLPITEYDFDRMRKNMLGDKLPPKPIPKLKSSTERITDILSNHPDSSAKFLSKMTGINQPKIYAYLNKMIDVGLVISSKVSKGRANKYRLNVSN